MLGSGTGPRTKWCAEDYRDLGFSPKHKTQLGSLVHYLIHSNAHKIAKLKLGHGTHSGQGSPDSATSNRGFGDRRIYNAFRSKFLKQPPCHAESATIDPDILAHHENA